MSEKDQEEILKKLTEHIDDAMHRVHVSKNKELSQLLDDVYKRFKCIDESLFKLNFEIPNLKKDVDRLSELMEDEVRPNAQKGKDAAENQSKVVWLVISLIIAALFGLITISR